MFIQINFADCVHNNAPRKTKTKQNKTKQKKKKQEKQKQMIE